MYAESVLRTCVLLYYYCVYIIERFVGQKFRDEIKFKLDCAGKMRINKFFVVAILICIHGESISLSVFSNENDFPVVTTKLGKIRGRFLESRLGNTFLAFRGIRYANAPINELRFQVVLKCNIFITKHIIFSIKIFQIPKF